jgi:hypothetical protein
MPYSIVPILPAGPVLHTYIGPDPLTVAKMLAEGKPPPQPVWANMLIDTGACPTSLDVSLVERLGLIPTGSVHVHTPDKAETRERRSFEVSIALPIGNNGGSFVLGTFTVNDCEVAAQGIDGLIGRDVLALARYTYDGPNGISFLSF